MADIGIARLRIQAQRHKDSAVLALFEMLDKACAQREQLCRAIHVAEQRELETLALLDEERAAVRALIERLEVANRERDRACQQHEAAAGARMDAEGLLDRVANMMEGAYIEGWYTGHGRGIHDGHPLTYGSSDHEDDWPDSDTKELLDAILKRESGNKTDE